MSRGAGQLTLTVSGTLGNIENRKWGVLKWGKERITKVL